MEQTILVVEPSFYGVSFVEEAKNLGCEVVAIVSDMENPKIYGYDGWYDDILICDVRKAENIVKVIEQSKYYKNFDALLPATDYASAETAKAAEILGVFGVTYEAAMSARNKDRARKTFQEKNVPSAKFLVVECYEEAEKGAEEIGYPVVIKPTNAASSQNVFFINNKTELTKAFDILKEFKSSYMDFAIRSEYLIEEYLEGDEFSVELFLDNGEIAFSEVTEKITSDLPYFVEKFHIFPTSILQDKKEEIVSVAKKAVDALGLDSGPAHVEVKYTGQGPKLIEVNGRPGGDNITSDLIKSAYGINVFKETVNKYLGRKVQFEKKQSFATAIGYITSDKEMENVYYKGLDNVLTDPNIIRHELQQEPISKVNVARSSDDRLGYVIVKCDSSLEAKQKVKELISKISLSQT